MVGANQYDPALLQPISFHAGKISLKKCFVQSHLGGGLVLAFQRGDPTASRFRNTQQSTRSGRARHSVRAVRKKIYPFGGRPIAKRIKVGCSGFDRRSPANASSLATTARTE